MRRLLLGAALAMVALSAAPVTAQTAPREFVLSPENNHLWAYDATTGQRQLLARAVNGPDPGVASPNNFRRDINGQICVAPDGAHVITGEDTVITAAGGSGSSHDPRIAGWGYFSIAGAALGQLTIDQVGKLAPAAGSGPTYTGDPDNYGCGFLDGNRLLTTAIGDTLPGQPANGQLFLWFGPFTADFRRVTESSGVSFFVGQVPHCEIDATLATAGGIAIDGNDVYVATNRPDGAGNPSAVWRYRGRWPTTPAECTPVYLAANITRTAVVPNVAVLPADPHAPTPSSVAVSPAGTLVVASVFSGTVAEYDKDGAWKRDLYPLSPVTPPGGPLGDTPYGVTYTGDGSLWIADLGIVGDGPAAGEGSLLRVRFAGNGNAQPAEVIADALTFPDGLGVYRGRTAAPSAPPGASTVREQASRRELPATGASRSTALGAASLSAGLGLARVRRRMRWPRTATSHRSW
jgi:hypothetical protein